jgi:hypothetical protein
MAKDVNESIGSALGRLARAAQGMSTNTGHSPSLSKRTGSAFRREKTKPIDVNRIAASAVETFLTTDLQSQNGRQKKQERHRLRTAGAVALGVALATAGHAAYSRAKQLDLDQVADRLEKRLVG